MGRVTPDNAVSMLERGEKSAATLARESCGRSRKAPNSAGSSVGDPGRCTLPQLSGRSRGTVNAGDHETAHGRGHASTGPSRRRVSSPPSLRVIEDQAYCWPTVWAWSWRADHEIPEAPRPAVIVSATQLSVPVGTTSIPLVLNHFPASSPALFAARPVIQSTRLNQQALDCLNCGCVAVRWERSAGSVRAAGGAEGV